MPVIEATEQREQQGVVPELVEVLGSERESFHCRKKGNSLN